MTQPSFSAFAALLLLLIAAPLVPGVAVRTKAILTGRRGAPVWQLYADLWKLARRGLVYSTTTTWMFRLAPLVVLATTLAAATLLPLDGQAGLLGFTGDAVAFAYLLGLGRFVLVLASLDTGSSFEGMGASREATFASIVEPGFFIALVALGMMANDFSLGAMLGRGFGVGGSVAALAPSALVAAALFVLALAECSRVPVDDPATHLELTMIHEVMVLDHSGIDFALLLYAGAVKLTLLAAVLVGVVTPRLAPGGWLGLVAFGAGIAAMGVAVGIVESVMARLRMPRVPLYVATGSALALFGLILLLR